jgi:hypothetical protein
MPAARQPYHAATGVARESSAELDHLLASVNSYAQRSIAELLAHLSSTNDPLRGAGLVVGSDIDPARIGNLHVRAHASEGRLFRTATEAALRSHGVSCATFVERDLFAHAAQVLARPDAALKRTLTELGRSLEGSWRRDDKAATLAAWLVLAAPTRSHRK